MLTKAYSVTAYRKSHHLSYGLTSDYGSGHALQELYNSLAFLVAGAEGTLAVT